MSTRLPSPPTAPRRPINADVPDVVRTRRGWYPRWWLLSAYLCTLIVVVGALLWAFAPCNMHGSFNSLCEGHAWQPWQIVASIWAVFLVSYFLFLIFGMGPIEMPAYAPDEQKQQSDDFIRFLKAISEFGPMSTMLILYGFVVLIGIFLMWFLNGLQPAIYALATIYVFVAHCCDFHRRSAGDRVARLLVYAFFTFVLAVIVLFGMDRSWPFGDMHWIVLATVVMVFVLCIVIAFFTRRAQRSRAAELARLQPAQQTAQQQLEASLAGTITPGYIVRSFWPLSMFFPNGVNRTV